MKTTAEQEREKYKSWSTAALREVLPRVGPHTVPVINEILECRQLEAELGQREAELKIGRDQVTATRAGVRATWVYVVVTAVFALIAALAYFWPR
ncbi:MAG: hypothetical protein QME77_05525 [bacterium]|nr:hypothetical protein [bacterium]